MKNKFPLISISIASFSALLSASCCVIPLMLLNLGIGGAWLSSLSVLQPFRPYFIIASILALSVGSYVYWRNNKNECDSCDDQPKQKVGMILLTAVAVSLIGVSFI